MSSTTSGGSPLSEDELIGVIITRQVRELEALEVTHPAWRIRVIKGRWWADRYAPPTTEQREAGVVPSVACDSAVSLSAALSVLDEITSRIR